MNLTSPRVRSWGAALATAQYAWPPLRRVLIGPEPARVGRALPSRERWLAYAMLCALLLCIVNVATVHGVASAHGAVPPGLHRQLAGRLPPTLAQQVLAVVAVTPVLLAARYPMLAWRLGLVALLLVPMAPAAWWGGWPWGPPQVLALLVTFCVAGLRQQRPELCWMWALSLIPWLLWLTADVPNMDGPISATIAFTAATVAVDSIRSALHSQEALADQTERIEAEQAQRAVLEERARIARELHDVVAHHMSLLAVRAESAPFRLTDLPVSARDEFASLSGIAREALSDMRRLLGVLRNDVPAGLSPQPQLADLPALVEAARRAGVSVELTLPTAVDPVPASVGVCAYRIVQESLSNASQHAPGAEVAVSVVYHADAVLLRVANGPGVAGGPGMARGPGVAGGPEGGAPRPGHGLTGMRERVTLLGGSMSAGPRADGGFVVSAVLPLGATAADLANAS